MQPTKIELIYHIKLTYFHIWISKFCNKKDAPAEYWFIVSTLKLSYKWLFQADCFHQIFYPFLSSVLIPTSFKLSDILCSLVMKVNRICVNLALKYVKICRNAVGYIFEKLDCLKSGEKLE